jgi:hypothetical protein
MNNPKARSASPLHVHPPGTLTPKTVNIPLFGIHGAGFYMTLDAPDWEVVKATSGERWTRVPNGHQNPRFYVTSMRRTNAQNAPGTRTFLARALTGATEGQIVTFRDGDPLNLRRANLRLMTKAEATDWKRALGLSQVQAVTRPMLKEFVSSATS